MVDYLTGLLMVIGSIFCLVASVGVVRLPDTLTRMHAATKAGTLGTGLLIIPAGRHRYHAGAADGPGGRPPHRPRLLSQWRVPV